jgi:hypothetical protein
MTRRAAAVAWVVAIALASAISQLAAQPAAQENDQPQSQGSASPGSSTFKGRLEAYGARNVPLADSGIGLATIDGPIVAETRTTADGSFEFADIRSGMYRIAALGPNYDITLGHVFLAAGRTEELILRRGPVLTGSVVDELGARVRGVTVCALRPVGSGSDLRLSASAWTTTEADGSFVLYRAPGQTPLTAGAYVPAVMPAGCTLESPTDVPANVARYPPSFVARAAASSEPFATITLDASVDAAPVRFALEPGPVTRLQGRLLDYVNTTVVAGRVILVPPDGPLSMVRTAKVAPDGRFSFLGLPPGTYRLIVPPRLGPDPPVWAREEVTVNGEAVKPLAIRLQDAVGIGGTATFGSRANPLPGIRVFMTLSAKPIGDRRDVLALLPTPFSGVADGRFAITGLMPGQYTLQLVGLTSLGLVGNSAIAPDLDMPGGQSPDYFDVPVSLAPGLGLFGLQISVARALNTVNGTVIGQDNRPLARAVVTLIPVDRRLWTETSRRLREVVTDDAGQFTLADLPEGDYTLVAEPAGPRPEDWRAPARLDDLVPQGQTLSLAVGEVRELAIRAVGSSRE